MKKFLVLFAAFTLPFIGCQGQTQSYIYPDNEWDRADPETVNLSREEIQDLRMYIVDSSNTTGLVAVVGGRIIYQFGDTEELSYLASCRKSILAMLYGKYVKDGQINLSSSLEELNIDDIQGLTENEKAAKVDHLITARSGIYHPASNGGDNSADAPERNSQKPGEYFLYNNWDFNAAGYIFESLTNQTIYEGLEKDLAIPIGMQDYSLDAQRKSGNMSISKYPAYHIWLSTRDMARIGYLMLREGKWKDQQVVSKEWIKKITGIVTPLEEMNPLRYRDNYFGYGYMWWVWDGPEANGPFQGAYSARGAYGQYITVFPAIDLVIAHKTKAEYGRSTSWTQYEGIFKRLINGLKE